MSELTAQTVWEKFSKCVMAFPDRPLLHTLLETAGIYNIQAGYLTYQQVFVEAENLANALQDAGFGTGHRIMVLLENRPVFFVWFLAINRIGASIVPINPDLR